jgi:hypothetical protein
MRRRDMGADRAGVLGENFASCSAGGWLDATRARRRRRRAFESFCLHYRREPRTRVRDRQRIPAAWGSCSRGHICRKEDLA